MKYTRPTAQSLIDLDPFLSPYKDAIQKRLDNIEQKELVLTEGKMKLADFAAGHEYFGLHFKENQWIFREWAPNATAIYLIGNMTGWKENKSFALDRVSAEGVWEIRFTPDALTHRDLFRLHIYWSDGDGDRIPTYARRVVQDPETLIFNAQVWAPAAPYRFNADHFRCPEDPLFIYEVHVGMAQEEGKIGSYREFTEKVLPRIVAAGYNALQLMAIQEHPYYGSFGYQVSNFFAASSRFGSPEELKALIDAAHESGLLVIMDLVHSHSVSNEIEGLSLFDGTSYLYFHEGERGKHIAWDSRCFDYGKPGVLHFLLSNCRFWLDEYHIDGFRFDGVTSMLYRHHGIGKTFTSYDDYFDESVDEDALAYLALANRLIHDVRPDAVTIAEDVSGMPGLSVALDKGGYGFDYRFAMGIPDYWIKLTKDTPDENWDMGHLWYELNNRRKDEKTISYAESHDQALVGDQTLIFRLIGERMYDHMHMKDPDLTVERGIALHKLIRLITLTTAGSGYLNFMANEFAHPEWIDFPREENNWSYHYARRQWHLVDDHDLKYHLLARFDAKMLSLVKQYAVLDPQAQLLYEHSLDKIIIFERAGLIFGFNFHPHQSYADYRFIAPGGEYIMIFDSDDLQFGGHGRLQPAQRHLTLKTGNEHFLSLYLPNRTALVLKPAT